MATLAEIIQTEADRCVKCGLCLPHCPTYVKTQHEGESPRGRIALLEGLAKNQLPLTKTLETHIDQCLACRACEVVCPAEVQYEKLFTHGKQYLLQEKAVRLSPIKRLINFVIIHPWLLKIGLSVLRIFDIFKIKIPKSVSFKSFYPTTNIKKLGKLALSPGCIHQHIDAKTLQDAIFVLNACGYDVYFPEEFICCGALHLHCGQANIAKDLAEKNKAAFSTLSADAIISTATGCTPKLQNHLKNVFDINTFLANYLSFENISFRPLNKKALLHTPCTLRNALKQADAPFDLLAKIPGLSVDRIKNKNCCGGAGTYFLEHPEMSASLANDIITEIKNQQADIFLTSNIGCAVHLKRECQKQKINIEVLHPISLMARQIKV